MANLFTPPFYVKGRLDGVNGNAFALMSHFKQQADRQDADQSKVDEVISRAMKGDYAHLVSTLNDHLEEDEEYIEEFLDDYLDDENAEFWQ